MLRTGRRTYIVLSDGHHHKYQGVQRITRGAVIELTACKDIRVRVTVRNESWSDGCSRNSRSVTGETPRWRSKARSHNI